MCIWINRVACNHDYTLERGVGYKNAAFFGSNVKSALAYFFSSRGHRKTLTSFGYRMHFIESEMYLSIKYFFAVSWYFSDFAQYFEVMIKAVAMEH